ncbi:MAG: tRNA (adenosine(37)-N6)-dimethylallyltransferase MiaA [Pseudomonadota bacterium]
MTVVCILGPTAMGKTEVALALHARGGVDIISVDSAMVYRGLDIGTAKPDAQTLAACPHALVDIVDPWHAYSVAQFIDDVTPLISASLERGRLPVLVGGTMLYFKRLFDGLSNLPAADLQVRTELDAQARELGWPALHAQLARVDPEAAARIASNDTQRIQRALEVYRLTGTPMSCLQQATVRHVAWPWLKLALVSDDRAQVHARIGQRFDAMMSEGFADEVRALLTLPGMHAELPSMRAVGYRQISRWLQGEISREQALADAKTATRRLAKRQHTWLRGMSDLVVFDPLESPVIDPIVRTIEERRAS